MKQASQQQSIFLFEQLEVGYLLKWRRMAIKGMQFTFISATLVRIFLEMQALRRGATFDAIMRFLTHFRKFLQLQFRSKSDKVGNRIC